MACNADDYNGCNGQLRAMLGSHIQREVGPTEAYAFRASIDPLTNTRAEIISAAQAYITVEGS